MDDRDRLRENLQKVMEETRGTASDEAMRAAHDRLSAAVEARIDSIGATEPGSASSASASTGPSADVPGPIRPMASGPQLVNPKAPAQVLGPRITPPPSA